MDRARWGLYLLTIVFVLEVAGALAMRGSLRPVLSMVLHAAMLIYYWDRKELFV